MKVGKIAHAGIIVEHDKTRLVMDPLFFNDIDCGSLELWPAIRVDLAKLRKTKFDAIILSHEHYDHFSPKSLSLLKRDVPVYYPHGASMIEHALRWLNFRELRPLKRYEEARIGALRILATPSKVSFPEMGILFRSGNRACLNLVDTRIDFKIAARLKRISPRIDLLLAPYQPMVETELSENGLGSEFPLRAYRELIQNAVAIGPRLVVPHSCGLKARSFMWINSRRFPVTEGRFLSDLRRSLKSFSGLGLEPGKVLDISRSVARTAKRLQFVRPIEKGPTGEYRWTPQDGVPPLVDDDELNLGAHRLRREIHEWMRSGFLALLTERSRKSEVSRLLRNGILWRLEIIYPDGKREERYIDFGRRRLSIATRENRAPDLQTAITATGLWGLISGQLSPSAVVNGGMFRKASSTFGKIKHEPLELALFRDAWMKNLRHQMKGAS
jgi:UDP-MurNAc hydroxylase